MTQLPRLIHETASNRTVDDAEWQMPPGSGVYLPWRKLVDALRVAGDIRPGFTVSHILVSYTGLSLRLEPVGKVPPGLVHRTVAPPPDGDDPGDADDGGLRGG